MTDASLVTLDADRHLVIGTGPLGLATAAALSAMGHAVALVNRTGTRPEGVSIPVLACNVLDAADRTRVFAGAAVIYQCAQPRYTHWLTEFAPLQQAILSGARAVGARVMLAENLYLYGRVDGPMREDSPVRPVSRKGTLRARLADEALGMHARGEVRIAIARGSDFYGPRVTGSALGDRVWEPLVGGRTARATGDPDLLHSYTYIDDFGRTLAMLGANPRGDGEVWHVPNAPASTTRALLHLAEPVIGGPVQVSGTSRLMMRVAGLFIPEARETVEMMYEFEHPFVVSSDKFTREFSLEATPAAASVAATVAWYQSRTR